MTSAEESTTTVPPLRPRKNMLIYDINFHCVLRRKFIAYLVLYPKRAITTHLGDWSQLVKYIGREHFDLMSEYIIQLIFFLYDTFPIEACA